MAERSLAWYWRRLRNMSLPEIAHRVVERARKSLARGRQEGWARYACDGPVPQLPGFAQAIDRSPAAWREAVAARAPAFRQGRFAALGVEWPPATAAPFAPERWRLDPVTQRTWPGPEAYCFDIPYRHERVLGDIKYVWEFNRLQWLQPMALHARHHADAGMLAAIEDALASWYAANPPFRGVAWCSGIELALRAISLLVVASLCGDRLSAPTLARLRSMLHAHLHWMRRYPSRFSSANNHRVAEAAGEFLVALATPELAGAAMARREARRVLEEEAVRQILADGCGAEQSPTYGAFTAEFLLLASFVGEAAGAPLAPQVDDRLRRFVEAVGLLAVPGGQPPAIGDDDEGRVLTDGQAEPGYAVAVARAIAARAGVAGPASAAAAPVLRDLVFGAPQNEPPDEAPVHRDLPDGGYAVIREQRGGRSLHLVLDHGDLGYLSIAAHGHADALSVCLALDGVPLFVDPGTYLYHAGGAWRDWFRGTAAHNTLTMGDADQSQITGPFNWGDRAHARLESFDHGADWRVVASHDGYQRRFGVVHRRELSARPTGLALLDRLDGAGAPRTAAIVLQLAPGLGIHREGHSVAILCGDKVMAVVRFDAGGELTLVRGAEGRDGGWVSPAFGRIVPAWRLVWRGSVGAGGVTTIVDWG